MQELKKKMINIQEIKKSVKALKAKVHQTHYIASINRLNSEKKKNIITDRFHLYSLMMQQHQQQQNPRTCYGIFLTIIANCLRLPIAIINMFQP